MESKSQIFPWCKASLEDTNKQWNDFQSIYGVQPTSNPDSSSDKTLQTIPCLAITPASSHQSTLLARRGS